MPAAEAGVAEAMAIVGYGLVMGKGARRDVAKGIEWLEKAGAKGLDIAHLELGLIYEEGLGVARNYKKANEWYEKAASQG